MNYRHAYHAGNFADVFKHIVLTRAVEYLKRKGKPFRVIDTHAGTGFYDLSSDEAQKTGEWRDGIGKLVEAMVPAEALSLIAPYLDIVARFNPGGGVRFYPGSPTIARELLRGQDRLTAIELHPADFFALRSRLDGDYQTRLIELDGWLALGAHVPPKEKRGLVLIDPPFEEPGEFDRMVDGLAKAYRRWPGGTYLFWYPIKDRKAVAGFRAALKACGVPDILDLSIEVRQAGAGDATFDGCGMVIANPPWALEAEMRAILPAITGILAQGKGAAWAIERIADERGGSEAGSAGHDLG